ncbi:MAG: hypothetical protein EA351_14155 [Gemmatimonadales bacterium]|nr:MAG: hypothetical protein EA351_14155 [Gemmatimonadales bacterium]
MSAERVVASIQPEQLSTSLHEGIRDRFVEVASYAPVETPTPFVDKLQLGLATKYLVHSIWDRFGLSEEDWSGEEWAEADWSFAQRAIPNQQMRSAERRAESRLRIPARRAELETRSDRVRTDSRYTRAQKRLIYDFVKEVGEADDLSSVGRAVERWVGHDEYRDLLGVAKGIWADRESEVGKYGFDQLDAWELDPLPESALVNQLRGLPDDTSPIGYLFLDAVRTRPDGFELGEHVYTLSLAPGEKAVLEQTSLREASETFEESLTRELSETTEASRERGVRRGTQSTDSESSERSTRTSATLESYELGAEDLGSVKAEMDLGVSSDFEQANALSAKQTEETFRKTTEKIGSSLRRSHVTKLGLSTVSRDEEKSRRTIRNTNPHSASSLHYFKVMQRHRVRAERRGARLCWTPFVRMPGSGIAKRLRDTREKIESAALDRLILPARPQPPRPEAAAEWIDGNSALVGLAQSFFLPTLPEIHRVTLRVPVPNGCVATGRVRTRTEGQGAHRVHVMIDHAGRDHSVRSLNQAEAEEYPDLKGFIEVPVTIFVAGITSPTEIFDPMEATVKIQAEVLRELPGYENDLEQYHGLLNEWEAKVAALRSDALEAVQPEIVAATEELIKRIDVRAELIDLVVKQYIEPMQEGTALEIERWHRLIDFANIRWVLYPGWWSGAPMPFPELAPGHILNASLARVFLPVRRLAGPVAPGSTYEEKLLYQLFRPDLDSSVSDLEYNQMVGQIVDPLFEAQSELQNEDGMPTPKPLGPAWFETVPTDGTHCEIVLSSTTGADEGTAAKSAAESRRLEAEIARIEAGTQLKERVEDPISAQISV